MSTPVSGGGQDTPISQSEVDVLSEGTNDSDETVVNEETTDGTEEPEVPDVSPEKEEEEEEEVPDEPEVEEPSLEEEEEITESGEPDRPSWKLIKEKYPELAKSKDFRELYFRDKAYTEVYPTVADAKEAAVKAEQLDALDGALVNGDVDAIIGNLNEHVLLKFSDKFLPSLFKANKTAFVRATKPFLVNALGQVLAKANNTQDEDLKKSVRNICRAIWQSPELPQVSQPAEVDPSVVEERERLQRERENLFLNQQRNFINAADRSVVKKMEAMVLDGFNTKDLNSFTRQAIIEKTLNDVKKTLENDEGLRNRLRQYHKLAAKSGFPDEYRARIVSASLDRAKRLIPMFRAKHRQAALGIQSAKGETKQKIVPKNEPVAVKESNKKIDMRKTSAEDFLNDKITFR